MSYVPSSCKGYVAGLLRYHYRIGIGLFRDSDGGFVAHPEIRRDVGLFRDGQSASCGDYMVAVDDHSPVMQR